MNEHSTWFHLLPGYQALESFARGHLERRWRLNVGLTDTHFTIIHVVISVLVAVLLIAGAMSYRKRVAASNSERLVPDPRFGLRNFFELVVEFGLGIVEGVMGREKAERYFPLVGTLVFFILCNNLVGLVPGFVPPTDTLKTNVALALLVFLMTHIWGIKAHGFASYMKHFAGPVWWLAPLMAPIEIFGHLVRPVSLSLRLMGNMVADHKVVATFFVLTPLLVPLPFYVLGLLVCVVQTLVFSLLTTIYIDMAVAHADH